MGGTPAVKMLREAMVGDEVEAVAGILNGTCNYILTEMEATGRSFAEVLAEAQRLGYAEADPTMDVGGFDAAHKITILAALAFGCAPDLRGRRDRGHRGVELIDIRLARDLGYRIKLVAARPKRPSGVSVSVHPALAPLAHPLAQAGGRAERALHRGPRDRPDLHPGPGRRRGADRRGGGGRHRRRDDRRAPAGVPAAGGGAEALRRASTPSARSAAPISA